MYRQVDLHVTIKHDLQNTTALSTLYIGQILYNIIEKINDLDL